MGRRPHQKRVSREQPGRNGPKKRSRGPSRNAYDTSIDEFDDAIDKFHKGADKIPLDVDGDADFSDDDAEEPVFDLKEEDSSEEEDDEDSDDDELDDEQLSGLAAKMAKQAKMLRQNTSLMDDEEEDEASEQEGKDRKAAWGKRKKAYYDADNADYELLSSDEEAPAEEEAEALRLQRQMAERLRPEDFDLGEEDDNEKLVDGHESSLQEVVARAEAKDKQGNEGTLLERRRLGASTKYANIIVEEVTKDVSALSKEEQMNVIMSDAPELVGLLAELKESLHELHNKIDPVLEKVRDCDIVNKEVGRFLETKHMLLLSYIQCIVFYLLLKAEGRSVRDHPVIARLVEIRTLLQKLEPIAEKLQNHIDKLLTSSSGTTPSTEIQAHENVKPSIQHPSSPSRKEENLPGVTLPNQKVPKNGTIEVLKAAVQIPSVVDVLKVDMHPPTITPQLPKPLPLVQSDDDDDLPDMKVLQRILNTKVQKRKPVISGDMDLPLKEDLGIRRAIRERQKFPNAQVSEDSDEQDHAFEDEFYQQAKRLKLAKQAAKEKDLGKIVMPEPTVEEEIGKRHITYQMEKNKGLTPHRKKLTKNPRKKYKLKHQRAVVRRKGQVREIKRPMAPYGGEATGIRATISRSVRFH